MDDTLIWAAVVFAPLMTTVVWLAPAVRKAVETWTASHAVSAAERDAAVQESLAGIAERRHRLAISQALIEGETVRERARLEAETAQYETDRDAAGKTLDAAVEARRQVIAARAEAEAELAPEAARNALDHGEDMTALAEAYAAYCQACPGTPNPFGYWVGNFRGLGG